MTIQTPLARESDQPAPGPATAATRVHRRVGSLRRTEPMYFFFIVPASCCSPRFVVAPACVGIFYSFTDYLGFGSWHFLGLENYRALVSDPSILASVRLLHARVRAGHGRRDAGHRPRARDRPDEEGQVRRRAPLGVRHPDGRLRHHRGLRLQLPVLEHACPRSPTSVGFGPLEQSILGDPNLAWLSIVIVSAWQTVPGALLVYTAGLTSIPNDVYEASSLDGAGAWKQLRSITLPLISGFIVINTVLGVKGYLGAYDVIVGLTNGGPGSATSSVAMTIFGGFTGGDYAYQMANATVFFVITVLISVLQLAATRGRNLRLA